MTLQTQYKKFLIKTVSKRPSKKRMEEIDEIVNDKKNQKKDVKELYNKEYFSVWKEIIAYDSNPKEISLLHENAKVPKTANITSLASGFGITEMFMAKTFVPKGNVSLIDISEKMSNEAKKYKRKLGIKNVNIKVSSANKTYLKEHSQDLVIARRSGLSSTNHWPKILREVKRILRENRESRFIYTVGKKHSKPKSNIIRELNKVDLRLIKLEEFKEMSGTPIQMIIAGIKK